MVLMGFSHALVLLGRHTKPCSCTQRLAMLRRGATMLHASVGEVLASGAMHELPTAMNSSLDMDMGLQKAVEMYALASDSSAIDGIKRAGQKGSGVLWGGHWGHC